MTWICNGITENLGRVLEELMIVVSDVDLTLIDPGGIESENCRHLFDVLADNNVIYGFATSRSFTSLGYVLPESLKRADFCICSDGAITLTRQSTDWLVSRRSILSGVRDILSAVFELCSSTASIFVFLDDRSDFRAEIRLSPRHLDMVAPILQGRSWSYLIPEPDISGGVLSVGVLASYRECMSLSRQVSSTFSYRDKLRVRVYEEVRIPVPDLWWCELSAWDADKGVALDAFMEKLRHRARNNSSPIIALGDGENDLGLANRADFTLCPPWANAELQRLGEVVPGVRDCQEFIRVITARLLDLVRS
jgi:hydroxymethylpyrimidine pyrophosphatase-like HAD family hydrolase